MIPIGDTVRTHRTPYMNLLIVGVTVAAFVYELSLGTAVDAFITRWGVVPHFVSLALVGDPRMSGEVFVTLITATFLHAGWLHLGSNMLFLWIFGDNVEDRLGHLRYLIYYLYWGAGASLSQVLVVPEAQTPLVGASGAIAGVLGAYLWMYPRAWVTVLLPVFFFLWPFPVPVILMLGIWLVTQLASGMAAITQASQATGGVAWFAHIGGFFLGLLLTPFLPKTPAGPSSVFYSGRQAREGARSGGASGCATRVLAAAWDVVSLLIGLRIVLRLLGVGLEGPFGFLAALVYALSTPLVEPFSSLLPAVRIEGLVLELFSLLALLIYYMLTTLLIGVLARARA